jgi:ribulose bisphosphate carboxylase small subunit
MRQKCKKEFCSEFAPVGQSYCSWQHAPFGYLCNKKQSPSKGKWMSAAESAAMAEQIRALLAQGYYKTAIFRKLKLTGSVYKRICKTFGIEDNTPDGRKVGLRYNKELKL